LHAHRVEARLEAGRKGGEDLQARTWETPTWKSKESDRRAGREGNEQKTGERDQKRWSKPKRYEEKGK